MSFAVTCAAESPQREAVRDGERAASEIASVDAASGSAPGPWDLPPPPPESAYQGPLFELSHAYPAAAPPPSPAPWRAAINGGRIDVRNAAAYTNALRDYVAADMKTLLFDYASWDPDEAAWYNQPWLAAIREPIRGSYVGSSFPPAMFPKSGLRADMTTHVVVYYDAVAAGSLSKVWGESGLDPVPGLEAGGAQFAEGSIIVKPAFTTATPATWPPLEGAFPVQLWASPNPEAEDPDPPQLLTAYLFQLDIIVKDSASAPKTQWVYATLTYDRAAPGSDPWSKMVPLGAMWGNDPDVVSPEGCDYLIPGSCPSLQETWISNSAPLYAKETLGWGGRLSGPNDGAVDITAVIQSPDGSLTPYPGRYAMSSCMSCHSVAAYEMQSFLLPAPAACKDERCTPQFAICDASGKCSPTSPSNPQAQLVYYPAGSPEFRRWFQDRSGSQPMDPGTIALDYDMVYSFKSLASWYRSTGQTDKGPDELNFVDEEFNNYRGLRFDP